ncbi:MAG: ADOP family duplicated permease [Gemmatimonadales bacterium]
MAPDHEWRPPVDREVDDELAFHVEMRTRDLIAAGMPPDQARAEALRKLGDLGAMKARLNRLGEERDRTRRRSAWWLELLADLRFGFRTLARQPGFTAIALVTLALGIGATTSIFSVLNEVVLRPLPVPAPEQIVTVSEAIGSFGSGDVSVGNFTDLRRDNRVFSDLAAEYYANFILTGDGDPERLIGARATASWFRVFAVAPLHGRAFTDEDDQAGAAPVAVLSHRLFERRFGADPGIVGRAVRLNGVPHTVVGVMPARFDFFSDGEELWTPAAFSAEQQAEHDGHFLTVVGRLKPGTAPAAAQASLGPLAGRLREQYPNANVSLRFGVIPIVASTVGDTATRIYVLFGAVCLVLLIGCMNVANLLLARGTARGRELALRAALGAGRPRIVRQLFVENVALALLAGLAGVVVAAVGIRLIQAFAPDNVPRLDRLRLNGPSVVFAFAAALASSVVFGLIPAVRTAGSDLFQVLREGSRGAAAASRDWLKRGLVAVEVGLSLVLLVGAGLLIRTAINLGKVDPGFDPNGLLSARVSLPATDYADWERVTATFTRLAEALGSQPGVTAAGLTSQVPMGPGGGGNGLVPEGRALEARNAIPSRLRIVTPGYLATMRIALKAGRDFTADDRIGHPRVTIVNQRLADAAFPGQDPIGKRLACCEDEPNAWKEIVGVVADVRASGIEAEAPNEFYLPVEQAPAEAWSWIGRTMTIAVRTEGRPEAATAQLRAAVKSIDPSLPIFQIATMDARIGRSLAESRFNTRLLTVLGAVGLILAAVGIYGVIAFYVARRTREIGIRTALGASDGAIRLLVLREGMTPVVAGVAVGVGASLLATRLVASQLRGVAPRDPLTLGVVAVMILAIAVVAILVPASAAVRVDPTITMREE